MRKPLPLILSILAATTAAITLGACGSADSPSTDAGTSGPQTQSVILDDLEPVTAGEGAEDDDGGGVGEGSEGGEDDTGEGSEGATGEGTEGEGAEGISPEGAEGGLPTEGPEGLVEGGEGTEGAGEGTEGFEGTEGQPPEGTEGTPTEGPEGSPQEGTEGVAEGTEGAVVPECKTDRDCPGTEICSFSLCQAPGAGDPCAQVTCPAGQECRAGACYPATSQVPQCGDGSAVGKACGTWARHIVSWRNWEVQALGSIVQGAWETYFVVNLTIDATGAISETSQVCAWVYQETYGFRPVIPEPTLAQIPAATGLWNVPSPAQGFAGANLSTLEFYGADPKIVGPTGPLPSQGDPGGIDVEGNGLIGMRVEVQSRFVAALSGDYESVRRVSSTFKADFHDTNKISGTMGQVYEDKVIQASNALLQGGIKSLPDPTKESTFEMRRIYDGKDCAWLLQNLDLVF